MSAAITIGIDVAYFLTSEIMAKLWSLDIWSLAIIICFALSAWLDWPRVNRIAKWLIYFDLAITALVFTMRALTTFEIIECNYLEDDCGIEWLNGDDASANCAPVADYAATNPYRDLPDDPLVIRAIKETSYIYEYLRDTLLPTSLPDTDYELCSTFLRSLETREDLTFLVIYESDIRSGVNAIASRYDSPSNPMAEEPFELQARFKALSQHWGDIEQAPNVPHKWESTWDTAKLPPLLKAQPLVVNGVDGDFQRQGGFKLEFTPEQEVAATKIFNHYNSTRSYKVSYLKEHPPKPLGWAPVAKQPFALHSAWEDLFPDGNIEAGRSIPDHKLAGNDAWRPIYGSLMLESVPWTWVQPGREEAEYGGLTTAEWEDWNADWDEKNRKREERAAKIKAWQDEVRPAREARERENFEKIQKEREEVELARKRDL